MTNEPTEAMIEAGAAAYHARWPNIDSDDKRNEALRAIYLAMQSTRPVDDVERLREALSLAMQALQAFGDTEEGVNTAYNILSEGLAQ